MTKRSTRARMLIGLAAIAVLAAACSATGASTAPSAAASYKIGYSNGGGVGNGFREEQVCTAKAEALASGQVSELTTIHRNTDAAGQLQDIRDLIAGDVDAIVFNPNDPAALNPALAEAKAAGIVTVSVDAYVTDPDAYNLYNNQVKYAELGATWLFEQLGGEGTVYYMRGFAGHPADTDRDIGFKEVLAEYPNITVVPNADGVHTGWDPATTTQLINDFLASGEYDNIQGIWTSGMDSQVVDAIKAAGKPYVPIVGADLGAFVGSSSIRLITRASRRRRTNLPPSAALASALRSSSSTARRSRRIRRPPSRTPVLLSRSWRTRVRRGKALLESWQSTGSTRLWPLGLQIEGYTSYTPEQASPARPGRVIPPANPSVVRARGIATPVSRVPSIESR